MVRLSHAGIADPLHFPSPQNMSLNRHLKNIAHGILGTFVSRNNDINGYWGIGILRLVAERNSLPTIYLDISPSNYNEGHDPFVTYAATKYRDLLTAKILGLGFDPATVDRAEIKLHFASFDEFPETVRDTRGTPYKCTVVLKLHNGVIREASKIGVCSPHDPYTDLRSSRV